MEVIVIGAGASGLMAAVTAAREGAKVTLLEKGRKPGRKLAVTGNGKCNLTNIHMDSQSFRGEEPDFVLPVLSQFKIPDTIRFFSGLGIYTKNRDGGIYPHSEQAVQVVQALAEEAAHRKVKCKYQTDIRCIEKKGGKFLVHTEGWTYEGDACILACGSPAAPDTGASADGYAYAQAFGHCLIPVYPVLTGLKTKGSLYPKLAGLRCEGKITVLADKAFAAESTGELQFTTYGISGIPAFQVSHYAVKAWEQGKKVLLCVDVLPDFEPEALLRFLEARAAQSSYKKASSYLSGLFHQKLIDVLLEEAGIPGNLPVEKITGEQIKRLARCIKGLSCPMSGHLDFSHAQACTGGVSTKEIHPVTMESRLVPGLYFAGEMVDIDGACGGYNLQWAWSSGYVAGMCAARGTGERALPQEKGKLSARENDNG